MRDYIRIDQCFFKVRMSANRSHNRARTTCSWMVAGTSAYRILSNGKRTRKAVVCSHEPATQRRLMLSTI